MSKKAQRHPPYKYPELSEAETRVLNAIDQLRDIQRRFGPLVIADGPLGNGDLFSDVIGQLVQEDARLHAMEERLTAFFQRPGTDVMMLDPIADDPKNESFASDVASTRAYTWGDIGYRLGLAVGMLLGPHAFDTTGGAR